MSESSNQKRPILMYPMIVWMIINTVMLLLLIPGDSTDLNNYLEPVLWILSIAGLLSMRKVGVAFATTTLIFTLSTSVFNVLIAYYTGFLAEPVGYVNALRIIINSAIVFYLWKLIFTGKFK